VTVPAIPASPSTPAAEVEADVSRSDAAQPARRRRVPWAALALGVVVAAGVVARFVAASHLWLDEALTVNISSVPLSDLTEALRHDGSPPLYYAVLHTWMQFFGDGTIAVRALSGICSVACLPLAWRVGERVGGRTVATAFLVLLALSPFAVQYATEARMYSMAMLLVLAGGLVVANLLERPSRGLCVAVALLTGALLLTHYYALYTVVAVGAVLAWHSWRGEQRAGARRVLASMVAGSLLFVPWLPVLLYQSAHTGAPWGNSGNGIDTVIDTLGVLVSGYRRAGPVPLLLAIGLITLAVFGRAVGRRRFEIDLVGREPGRTLAVLTFGGLLLAVAVSDLTGQAYVPRYASIVFPGVLLVIAVGVASFGDARLRLAALVVMGGLGILGIQPIMAYERTQAADVARQIRAEARPGDLVVYCPDQLGPSVSRLIPDDLGVKQITYPRAQDPSLVDWVDYRAAIRETDVLRFAWTALDAAGPANTVWYVWSIGYKSLGRRCEQLLHDLGASRQWTDQVRIDWHSPEHLGLIRFAPVDPDAPRFTHRCNRAPGC
jgi:4-amino-4-deoxy-L-arabinose transferase-like glycosyltransferase